ncbi:MAG TPA: hypothetical protein VN651_12955 [Gemmatimonadaceae bacterium]|nr:hypothetical protein [Gemmatimonadaceae bacterium]
MANDSVSYCRNAAVQLLRDTIPNTARGGGRVPRPPVTIAARPMDDYRAIVERWVVPAYDGRPLPRAHWETSRGAIEIEFYAGDTPLATDALEGITKAISPRSAGSSPDRMWWIGSSLVTGSRARD